MIVLGLVLLPVLLANLPKEEVGIWLLLGQSWAVLGVLDLGFGVTLTRRIALAKGKSGGNPDVLLNEVSVAEIADLVATSSRIYRYMSAGVFLVAWSLGFFYLHHLELSSISSTTVWTAWTILCACQALTVWATPWSALLQGVGHVGWDAILATIINALTLVVQIVSVIQGGGVVTLASIATVGVVAQRVVIRGFTSRRNPELFALKGKWNPGVLLGMPSLALRAWISTLGGVMVMNTDGFFIAAAEGAGNIPAYRAAFIVVLNVHVLAGVFAQSSSVFMSQLWQAGQREEVRRIFERNSRIGLCLILCGGAAIIFSGKSLFDVWLGPGNYVGPLIVGLFVLLFVLEQQSLIISTSCRATDCEPFAGWMMAGGLLKLALAVPLMKWLGLVGLTVATLVAQLSTAHWFVMKRGLQRLEFPFSTYISRVLVPCLIVFVVACVLTKLSVVATSNQEGWLQLVVASTASGAVLIVAWWLLVLQPHHRHRILARYMHS